MKVDYSVGHVIGSSRKKEKTVVQYSLEARYTDVYI